MMRRWRDERYTGDGISRFSDDLVNLKARQLSALTRLCTLGHLNLYLFGIHEVFGSDTKTTRCDLLGL